MTSWKRWTQKNGLPVEVSDSPSSNPGGFAVTAADAVGMCDQRYRQAKEVVEAAAVASGRRRVLPLVLVVGELLRFA